MAFDPLTLFFVVFGLMPNQTRARAANWCAQSTQVVTLRMVAVIIAAGVLIPLAHPLAGHMLTSLVPIMVVLVSLSLMLRLLGSATTPSRRYGVLIATAALWHLFFRLRSIVQTASDTSAVDFWFLDYVISFWLQWMVPLLDALGMESSLDPILVYLSPSLLFLSDHLLVFQFTWCVLGIPLLYRMLAPDISDVPAQPPSVQMPRWLPTLGLILWLLRTCELDVAVHETCGIFVAQLLPYVVALLVLDGMGKIYGTLRTLTGRTGSVVTLIIIALVGVLHPTVWWVPVVASGVGSLGLLPAQSADEGKRAQNVQMGHVVLAAMRRYWLRGLLAWALLNTLFSVAIGLTQLSLSAYRVDTTMGVTPKVLDETNQGSTVLGHFRDVARSREDTDGVLTDEAHGRATEQQEMPVPHTEHVYWIDRYEYPNQAQGQVKTLATPTEARRLCETRGQHLCSLEEWSFACSDGGKWTFIYEGSSDDFVDAEVHVLEQAERDCNIRTSLGKEDPSALGTWPSGTGDQCRPRMAVYDLVGNAFEWVEIPELEGIWGLMGSSYLYRDQRSMRCDTPLLIPGALLPIVDLSSVGFRCCGQSTPSDADDAR